MQLNADLYEHTWKNAKQTAAQKVLSTKKSGRKIRFSRSIFILSGGQYLPTREILKTVYIKNIFQMRRGRRVAGRRGKRTKIRTHRCHLHVHVPL